MFIIDETVFIHVPKCGGSSVKESLFRNRFEDLKYKVAHNIASQTPSFAKKYRKIALVRDPKSWYKSFYFYCTQRKDNNFLLKTILNKEPNNFNKIEFVSFDVFMERALNYGDFLKKYDVPGFYASWRYSNNPHLIANMIGDVHEFEKYKGSFYNFFFSKFLDTKNIHTFRLENEEELDEVYKILKIPKMHVNKTKITEEYLKSYDYSEEIEKVDKKWRKRFGY